MFVHHGPIDDHDVPGAPFALLVARMRTRLAEADLDCRCRDEIENRLSRLEDDNAREEMELALVQARAFRDAVARLLSFLDELDELGLEERDASAFAEAAGIFDDINMAAAGGAAALRRIAASQPSLAR